MPITLSAIFGASWEGYGGSGNSKCACRPRSIHSNPTSDSRYKGHGNRGAAKLCHFGQSFERFRRLEGRNDGRPAIHTPRGQEISERGQTLGSDPDREIAHVSAE